MKWTLQNDRSTSLAGAGKLLKRRGIIAIVNHSSFVVLRDTSSMEFFSKQKWKGKRWNVEGAETFSQVVHVRKCRISNALERP